ncbi:MAG: protoheme IX farnesyltransferase [Acidobacteria bacterium]|nr:protoheme IX farnesyltransferase [Acidobacteriota bacterium]
MTSAPHCLTAAPRPHSVHWADYWELTKPEVTGLVLVSALAGFYLGTEGALDWALLFHTLLGTGLVSAGTAAFNMFWERADDALMRRTARRPLPAGRLEPAAALWFAAVLSVGGVVYLAFRVNLLASGLAFLTWATYLFFYTPLKKKTVWCTAVGAFPGAMPPLLGWAAARGTLTLEAWILYAILFLWQFPHFLSIAWMYREDYDRAGMRMLPVMDSTGRATAVQIVFYSLALLPLGLAPTLVGMAGRTYYWGALLLGVAFLSVSLRVARKPSKANARWLLHATVVYLPLLFGLLMLDKQ